MSSNVISRNKVEAHLAQIAQIFPKGILLSHEENTSIPQSPGAYALWVWLDQPLAVSRGKLRAELAPGVYIYAGSARGPGGLRARLGRHLAAEKPLRWHIDELTTRAAEMAAVAIPGGDECAIVSALLASGGFAYAVPGFGSSDCRRCDAHLLTPRAAV